MNELFGSAFKSTLAKAGCPTPCSLTLSVPRIDHFDLDIQAKLVSFSMGQTYASSAKYANVSHRPLETNEPAP